MLQSVGRVCRQTQYFVNPPPQKKTLTAEWMQWMPLVNQEEIREKRFLSVAYGLGKYRSDLAIWILGETPRMSNECRLDVLQR